LSLNKHFNWQLKALLWRLRNPGRPPEDYYVEMTTARLRRGSHHPALGERARPTRAPTELLDILLTHGLKPEHVVVDYGCGSFRLGKALIEYLAPGNYWGLDVTDEFFSTGMELLEPELKLTKRPHAHVITSENLAVARDARPDFIISWHVCSKVPPARLPDYFGKITSLMGPGSLALVHFPEASKRKRQSRFSWAESRELIDRVIRKLDPGLEIGFAPITETVSRGVRQTMVEIRRPRGNGSA
jgi:cyclopropane fatty-acyl-phospholipid synthase-like methyltransferase